MIVLRILGLVRLSDTGMGRAGVAIGVDELRLSCFTVDSHYNALLKVIKKQEICEIPSQLSLAAYLFFTILLIKLFKP
jgi:hypothetical protein